MNEGKLVAVAVIGGLGFDRNKSRQYSPHALY
jgi:hypothetical protein